MAGQDKSKGNRTIHVGHNYIEHVERDYISQDTIQQVNAPQFAAGITPQSSKEDVAKLLTMIREELATLNLPADRQEEVAAEVQAAVVQAKKETPDKPKIADRLKGAAAALKEAGTLGTEAVALGNAIGKVILWCGEQWTTWMM